MLRRLLTLLLFLLAAPAAALQDGVPTLEGFPYNVRFWASGERLATRVLNLAQNMRPLPGLRDRDWQQAEIDIALAPNEATFSALTGGRAPEWGAGVAIPSRSLIVLPAYGSANRGGPIDFPVILRHEIAHIAVNRVAARPAPLWFDEGYATWSAGQLDWDSAWMLRMAFITGSAPPLDSLELTWPRGVQHARIAYLLSASFIAFLVDESGERGLQVLFERWKQTGDFDRALELTYGTDLGRLESQWRNYVKRKYGWAVFLTQSLIFLLTTGFAIYAMLFARRRRDRNKLAALKAAELPDDPAFWHEGGIEIIAHRGFSARAPENTIAAMRLALEQGATSLEFDLHASRDGVPMVIHDATLERTTNGHGRIAHKSAAELREVDAGSWFAPQFIGERLPTFDELLEFVRGKVNRLYIELKPGGFNPAQIEYLAELILHHNMVERVVIMSFDWGLLDIVRSLPIPFTIAFLADDEATCLAAIERARDDRNAVVDCNYRVLLTNKELVERAHSLGLELAVYTVNDLRIAEELVELGVRRLTTNEVEKLLKWSRGR